MRTIQVTTPGGAEVLRMTDLPLPEPGAQEVRVRIEAAGVNFIDIYQRTGLYPMALPFTPGMEGAGVIDAVGSDVKSVSPGARVAYAMTAGAYAEYAVVPAAAVVELPGALSTRLAAAVFLQGLTVHYLVTAAAPLEAGSTALVHAAAGGVGRLLVQAAKDRGATVPGHLLHAREGGDGARLRRRAREAARQGPRGSTVLATCSTPEKAASWRRAARNCSMAAGARSAPTTCSTTATCPTKCGASPAAPGSTWCTTRSAKPPSATR